MSTLKDQRVIHLTQFLLAKTKVSSRDGSIGVVEEFSEFNQGHLTVLTSHLHYLTAEGLAERMCREVVDSDQSILDLYLFENNIDPLNGDDIPIFVQETFLL